MKQTRFFFTQTNAAIFLLIGSLVLALSAFGQTNLISNGSFEQPTASPTPGIIPTGWAATSDYPSQDTTPHFFLYSYLLGWPRPTLGDQALAFNDANTVPNVELSQTVSELTAGQSYTLTFDMGVNASPPVKEQILEVRVTHASPASTTFIIRGLGGTGSALAWQPNRKFTFKLDPGENSTTITFHDISPGNHCLNHAFNPANSDPCHLSDNIDFLLDNVRLYPAPSPTPSPSPVPGLLKVSSANPRYFTTEANPNGAMFMVGSHNWQVLQDRDDKPHFDYDGWLKFLQQHNHNFFRMWYYDVPLGTLGGQRFFDLDPIPFPLIGSKYDVTSYNDCQPNQDCFFRRLRERCEQARDAGIYVDVMLSSAWWQKYTAPDPDTGCMHDMWYSAYWNPDNVTPPGSYTLSPQTIYTLGASSGWLDRMDNFIRHMVYTVRNLDNVVFEVANEGDHDTFLWQKHVITVVHDYEQANQNNGYLKHLVGFTAGPGAHENENAEILASEADWVSLTAPETVPMLDPTKPDMLDTDHTFGIGGNPDYLWKGMMRGHNSWYMDVYGQFTNCVQFPTICTSPVLARCPQADENMRTALGVQRTLARNSDIVHTAPMPANSTLVSTGYALVNNFNPNDQTADHAEYLIYYSPPPGSPSPVSITIQSMHPRTYSFEWLDPTTGDPLGAGTIDVGPGTGDKTFPHDPAPFGAVLHVRAALDLVSAVSRKTHGGAGNFDINLPLSLIGLPGVECRSTGGAHTLVFTFTNNVVSGSASVTPGTGGTASIDGSPIFANNTMTVNLAGVTNAQVITVTLDVIDNMGQHLNQAVRAGILIGDASGNGTVNGTDVNQVKLQSGVAVGASNFRSDLAPNGTINASDVGIVKNASGTSLP